MGAEVGATTSTFPYSANMRAFLYATGRGPVARAADKAAQSGLLSADEGAEYDEVIEIVRVFMSISIQSNLFHQEPLGAGAYHQWPVYPRFGDSALKIRLLYKGKWVERRILSGLNRIVHELFL